MSVVVHTNGMHYRCSIVENKMSNHVWCFIGHVYSIHHLGYRLCEVMFHRIMDASNAVWSLHRPMTSALLGDKRSQVNCYSSRYHPAPSPLASPSHNQGSALDRSINLFLHSYASLPYLPFFAPNRTLLWCLIRIEWRGKEHLNSVHSLVC